MEINRIKIIKWYWVAIIFVFGIIIGWLSAIYINQSQDAKTDETRLGGYKYINPLLECNTAKEIGQEIKPFKSELVNFINDQKNSHRISQASVYYRDLNNGPWIGINEKDEFSPASMLKVPLMMAVLKKAENDQGLLNKIIAIESNQINDSEQIIKPSQTIKAGEKYTVDELLYRMIVFSDNNAQLALFRLIGDEAVARVYSDLSLAVPSTDQTENFMRVKDYASFFRILYNASYLNKSISERVLESLTKVEYRQGLVAGVPADIIVAHKFGERIIAGDNNKQLHDCGIVYYPNRPYLLCIMSRGDNFFNLADFIKNTSSFVYQKISEQNKK